MHFDPDQDGIGLDLSPFVSAINTGADTYAKVKAADAALAAAKRSGPAVTNVTNAPAASRKPNMLAYLIMGGAAIGGFLIVRKLMGGKRRR